MENISATNCQYVQVLDLNQARPSHMNPHPTYITHSNLVPPHLSFLGGPSTSSASSIAFPSSGPPTASGSHLHGRNHNAYVTQTLQELMSKPKKTKNKSQGPYGRHQIPLDNHADLMRFNPHLIPSGSSSMQRVVDASSSSGSSSKSPRKKVSDRLLRSEHDYHVFIPKKSLTCNQFNTKIDCKGCGKMFNGVVISMGVIFGEPAYFVHCVKECPKYRELGLIRKCDECALLFMNSQSERKHHGESHRKKARIEKPVWMSDQVYRVRSGIRCNTKVSCSACGKYFGAQNSAGKISYSLDYMIHCIEDCVEYHKLGLVQTCPTCNCKFLNRLSLSQHKLKSKH